MKPKFGNPDQDFLLTRQEIDRCKTLLGQQRYSDFITSISTFLKSGVGEYADPYAVAETLSSLDLGLKKEFSKPTIVSAVREILE